MQTNTVWQDRTIRFPVNMPAKRPKPVQVDEDDRRFWKPPPWVTALAATIGAIAGIGALILALWDRSAAHSREDFYYRVDERIVEKLNPVNDKLREISEKVAKLQGILETVERSARLKKIAALQPREFAGFLPELHKTISKPLPAGFATEHQTLQEIASKLRQTPTTAQEYWPTVLQFIQFASSSMTPPVDVPPVGSPPFLVSNVGCHGFSGSAHCLTVSHQMVILDGGSIPNSIFDHCRIKFTENPVDLRGVKFIDCVFEMPLLSNPNPYLRSAARKLLASNLTKVSFPGA